jgi:anti-sigma factor RsiW
MMTRPCEEMVSLLGPFADGELPADDRAWVEGHLDGCANCRERRLLFLAQGAALREAVRARAAAAPMAGFADAVMARIAREGRARKPWDGLDAWATFVLGPHRLGFGATAGVALAAGLALVLFLRPPPDGLPIAGSDVATQAASASIDALDIDDRSNGAILQLRGAETPSTGPATTVIWVSDEPASGVSR